MLLSLLACQRAPLARALPPAYSFTSSGKPLAELMKERSALFPLYTHYYK